MRHLLAGRLLYIIAVLLLLVAAVIGYVRSAQWVLSDERTVLAQHEPAPEYVFLWGDVGRNAYIANCMNCHGRQGRGWDQYPGLGHTAALFVAPGGREYLLDLHIYGLASERWRAPMPPMGHMPDVALAAVVNYVLTSFGNEHQLPPDAKLYTPAEVAQRRALGLTPSAVDEQRPVLK